MANYKSLSNELNNRIMSDIKLGTRPNYATPDDECIRRRDNPHDYANVWRGAYLRDVDKILHCPLYNRYADKTQVFSLARNDDLTRRGLHVQIVSRIARTIGATLGLNLDLIEAIALGHDIGHTPFGHTGERFLDEFYSDKTGRRFLHNVHSVRVLDKIFPLNITLQTLDGILSHNGELELDKYAPVPLNNFSDFDEKVECCYTISGYDRTIIPSTLEGCVVRISDIIAYLGKDRHDAEKSGVIEQFQDLGIGTINAEITNNLMVNIIENSYGHDYIKMDKEHFSALTQAKRDNYTKIYTDDVSGKYNDTIKIMMSEVYDKLLYDLTHSLTTSPIFTHHIAVVDKPYYKRTTPYLDDEPNQIVVDYIASMTDDYFIDLHAHLFPSSTLKVKYKGYFE